MERPEKAGAKYELTAHGSTSERMVLNVQQQVVKEDGLTISGELAGIITILETDELMREKKIKLTITRCVMSKNSKAYENDVLKKGTEIIARLDNHKETFLVNDKPVPEEVDKFLGLFISANRSRLSDDDVFGTKERKKVGDSWPVNSTLAARDLTGDGMPVATENVKGSTKLEKLVDVDGIKCLHLTGNLQINHMNPPMPPGFILETSNLTGLFSGDYPVDASMAPLSKSMTMTAVFSGKGKPGPDSPEFTLTVEKIQSSEEKCKYLK